MFTSLHDHHHLPPQTFSVTRSWQLAWNCDPLLPRGSCVEKADDSGRCAVSAVGQLWWWPKRLQPSEPSTPMVFSEKPGEPRSRRHTVQCEGEIGMEVKAWSSHTVRLLGQSVLCVARGVPFSSPGPGSTLRTHHAARSPDRTVEDPDAVRTQAPCCPPPWPSLSWRATFRKERRFCVWPSWDCQGLPMVAVMSGVCQVRVCWLSLLDRAPTLAAF